jgi:hypothetical protein
LIVRAIAKERIVVVGIAKPNSKAENEFRDPTRLELPA